MIDVRANTIIYQSQIYYRNLINDLVVKKKDGKALQSKWEKADIILGYLEALNYRDRLTEQADIDDVNFILECLIKLCELNQYPTASPLTFQAPPAVIVGQPGQPGATGGIGPRGYTGLATDFSYISTSVTVPVDSFQITDARAARWDYFVIEAGGAQRVSSVLGQWTADGLSHEISDMGAEDLAGDTSGIEFDISISGTTVQLLAIISSGTWSITGSRYFIPNNGNGSGPITNVLPLGQVYIGNSSNQAQAQTISGVISITSSGVVSYNAGSISDIAINNSANITLTKLASLNNNVVPITNGSGKLISSTLSPTTLGYIDISSSLTGLLNAKLTDPLTSIGDILIRNVSNITTRLGIGTANQVLTVVGGVPTWQNASGGISGLTTSYLPKASSSTTLANSIISETTGAILIAGTLEAQGGIKEVNGAFLKKKILSIGSWNMYNLLGGSATKNVAHGLSDTRKIRTVSVTIVSDSNVSDSLFRGVSSSNTTQQGFESRDNTNIILTRLASGIFDGVQHLGSSNRGYVTIEYEV